MQLVLDASGVYFDRPEVDLRVMCGPRYNAFSPAGEHRETPGTFFQREAWKAMSKPRAVEDETERWDGLE